MLELCDKKIEVDSANSLTSKFAIYVVEFEYDNRVYVGHTIMQSVKSSLRKLINSVLSDSARHPELLKESMQNSDVLYVTVKEPSTYTLDELFRLKYDLILSYNSYEPYGFNRICMIGNKYEEEKKYIKLTEAKIGGSCEKTVLASNARHIKEYTYSKNKGYTEIAEWPSITAAAKYYNLNASNIAACCSGRLNTAYGRVWRYSD